MTSRSSYITVTDQFCGAGGSSLGASLAGAEIRLALNHWRLAVETHNTNFPNTDHDCTDIQAVDPRRYVPTDILITSPECTNHSLAKGKVRKWQQQLDMFGHVTPDPGAERSRATMWDVCRFAEAHHYRIVIVENVVEARHWAPFPAWLQAMHLLGYDYQIVYLNSMHAHKTPQSRDRMYVVFHLRALRRPNLDIRPAAYCERCACNVPAVQSWKNPRKPWGKYKQQYLYRCPTCAGVVEPYYYAALNAIDWSLTAPRIGDRARPLKDKTLKRIQVGLEKFGRQTLLIGNYSPGWARPVSDPAGTVTSSDHHSLLTPPPFLIDLAYTHGHDRRATGMDEAAPTQTGQQTQAIVLPFLVEMYGQSVAASIGAAIGTQTGVVHHGVVVPIAPMPTITERPPFLVSLNHSDLDRVRGLDEPLPTTMPQGNPFLVDLRGANAPRTPADPLSTVCGSGNHHGVVVPFLTSYNSTSQGSDLTEAIPTQDTRHRHALVVPPFVMGIHKDVSYRQIDEALQTVVCAGNHHFLAQPGDTPAIEDCGFRMLQPHEIGAAMAFPADYVVLGNQRERVKQYGNAVTPPVLRLIMERCMEVLDS